MKNQLEKTCKKKSFDTFEDANNKLTQIMNESTNDVIPIRVYRCIYCDKYHLTSKEKTDYQKNVQKKINLIKLKNKKRDESFIRRESEYWERIFKIN